MSASWPNLTALGPSDDAQRHARTAHRIDADAALQHVADGIALDAGNGETLLHLARLRNLLWRIKSVYDRKEIIGDNRDTVLFGELKKLASGFNGDNAASATRCLRLGPSVNTGATGARNFLDAVRPAEADDYR